jgi:hypothetical protein
VTRALSDLVTSRAAVDALSSIVDLNRLDTPLPMPPEPDHAHEPRVLLLAWGMMLGQALLFAAIAWWQLHRRKR